MNKKIDSEHISQEAAFRIIFPGVKYHKGQLSSTRIILAHAGDRLQRRFWKYGTTSDGTWRKLKALLPKTILDKGFADHQAIRDLKLSADDYSSDTTRKQIISTDDSNSDSESMSLNGSHTHSGLQCPFCDKHLRCKPSAYLVKLLEVLLQKSWPDLLPWNPGHCKAKVTDTIAYCNCHHMESNILPMATCEGWPLNIDFSALYEHVLALNSSLRLLLDPDLTADNEFYKKMQESFAPGTSKEAASSIGGQWVSFKGHGAGYYGLEGYQIILIALICMFPDNTFDVTPFHPLDFHAFRSKVLLPEAGILLIQQDLPHLSRKDAIKTMENSQLLGAEMHPGENSPHINAIMERTARMNHHVSKYLVKVEVVEAKIPDSSFEEVVENGKVVLLID
ncbi:hypothetical protein PILCRDRAFT_12382 [Piloderma croceum F 1598]|uniref:Restriction of telomere capping protein 4 n=1 Tax=Piloderma croceum (strain F 1598) TaxID=765440 RepID=A0A0C3FBD6_PILCF|nr:hypothetical protein PILCRDRAFT_12382 [Piloderma croceum F 1598]